MQGFACPTRSCGIHIQSSKFQQLYHVLGWSNFNCLLIPTSATIAQTRKTQGYTAVELEVVQSYVLQDDIPTAMIFQDRSFRRIDTSTYNTYQHQSTPQIYCRVCGCELAISGIGGRKRMSAVSFFTERNVERVLTGHHLESLRFIGQT